VAFGILAMKLIEKMIANSQSNEKEDWGYVIPDSEGDTLLKGVCK